MTREAATLAKRLPRYCAELCEIPIEDLRKMTSHPESAWLNATDAEMNWKIEGKG